MNLRKLILIATLGFCGIANAEVVTIVDAVETVTSNISFPTTASGRLMFRPCAGECDEKFIVTRLTPETIYSIGGRKVDFREFRTAFLNMRKGGDDYALVSYHTETNTVASLNIGQ